MADILAAEVTPLARETKTDAVTSALAERLQIQRLVASGHQASLVNQLNQIGLRCAARATRDDRSADEILGYHVNRDEPEHHTINNAGDWSSSTQL